MKKSILSKISVSFFVMIFFFTLFLSCVGANYGGLRLSNDVNKIFESHQVLDDYNYYYSGSDNRPAAILGVHKDYTLRSNLWKSVEMTSEQLKLWVNMMTDHRGTDIRIYGSRVISPDGKDIGIWYSPWNHTTVRMEDDGHVVINTPSSSPIHRKRGLLFGAEED
jgi:hypothetical protein